MPIEGFSDYITPLDRFFVRSHVYTPRVDIGQWHLTIDGEVANAPDADDGRPSTDAVGGVGQRARVRGKRTRLL
jgi:hypothetical protein